MTTKTLTTRKNSNSRRKSWRSSAKGNNKKEGEKEKRMNMILQDKDQTAIGKGSYRISEFVVLSCIFSRMQEGKTITKWKGRNLNDIEMDKLIIGLEKSRI